MRDDISNTIDRTVGLSNEVLNKARQAFQSSVVQVGNNPRTPTAPPGPDNPDWGPVTDKVYDDMTEDDWDRAVRRLVERLTRPVPTGKVRANGKARSKST